MVSGNESWLWAIPHMIFKQSNTSVALYVEPMNFVENKFDSPTQIDTFYSMEV